MLRVLESEYLSMSFRSWDLYEFPIAEYEHSWAIKTAIQLEKPWLSSLQTNKKKKNNNSLRPL